MYRCRHCFLLSHVSNKKIGKIDFYVFCVLFNGLNVVLSFFASAFFFQFFGWITICFHSRILIYFFRPCYLSPPPTRSLPTPISTPYTPPPHTHFLNLLFRYPLTDIFARLFKFSFADLSLNFLVLTIEVLTIDCLNLSVNILRVFA